MSSSAEQARDERKRLEWEYRDCICSGTGLVTIYHPEWNPTHYDRRFPIEIAAHCDCKVGNWLRERTDPEQQRRIPRIGDIKAGRSKWLLKPPRQERDVIEEIDAEPPPSRDQINAMFGRTT